ncbi:hypothetical protein AVEN_168028-1 [Araneus ventricosus]|uniref:Uncharacterized protein n=1 Tax=Araneus ventricosus TaxID=182803 RepID=A0A4Y2JVM8_ARAVE|nr:hypothetical protein AVEN_168028-1 [Araneus ventricosus]
MFIRSVDVPKSKRLQETSNAKGTECCSFCKQISTHELLKMIQDDVPMDGWDFIKYPSHTQAVERIVKLVTEASRKRVEPQNRDEFIRAALESRK